jgi:hypothetical protein
MRIHDPESLSFPEWFGVVLVLVVFVVLLVNWLNMTIWSY